MFTVMFTPMAIRCLTCFHPISIPIMTLNQILRKRLGPWCRFSLVYTQWFWRQIFDSGQGFKTFSVYADVQIVVVFLFFFQCSITLVSVLFQTKDLGLWYLWVMHQQTDGCIRWTVNLHHQMIHVSVSLYVAKALLYQQLYSSQF